MQQQPTPVRIATLGDQSAVEVLWMSLLESSAGLDRRFRPSADALDRLRADYPVWLKDTTRLLAVAEVEGEVVGFVSAHLWAPEPILEEDVEAFVEYLFVAEEHRRQGIAGALVGRVEEWAGGLGATRLRLRSLALSLEAAAFWASRGAHPFSVEMLYDLESRTGPPTRVPMGFRGNSA